jgi:hypothetical protein
MGEMETVMLAASASARKDALFRRHVDWAVHEAMRHFDHIETDVDRRDLHYAATIAAMAVLRQSIDNDTLLRQMEEQRDRAQEVAVSGMRATMPSLITKDMPLTPSPTP